MKALLHIEMPLRDEGKLIFFLFIELPFGSTMSEMANYDERQHMSSPQPLIQCQQQMQTSTLTLRKDKEKRKDEKKEKRHNRPKRERQGHFLPDHVTGQ